MINYLENKKGRKITFIMMWSTIINCFFSFELLMFVLFLLIGIFLKMPNVDMNTIIHLGLGKSRVSTTVYFFIIPISSIYYFLSITFAITYAIVWKNFKNNKLIYIFIIISLLIPLSFAFQYWIFNWFKYKINKRKCEKDPNIKLEKPLYWDFLGHNC